MFSNESNASWTAPSAGELSLARMIDEQPIRGVGDSFSARLDQLAALGYRRIDEDATAADVLVGPSGVLAIAAEREPLAANLSDDQSTASNPALTAVVRRILAQAHAVEDAAALDRGSVRPVLCLMSSLTSGNSQLDGVDIVSVSRLRAWFMVQPSTLSVPQVSVLYSRIARRPASPLAAAPATGRGAAA